MYQMPIRRAPQARAADAVTQSARPVAPERRSQEEYDAAMDEMEAAAQRVKALVESDFLPAYYRVPETTSGDGIVARRLSDLANEIANILVR